MKNQKQLLRKQLLKQRQLLTQQQWQTKSHQICQQLRSNYLFAQANTVLCYFSFRQEPDLSELWQEKSNQKQWGFPRCHGNKLDWYLWQPKDALELNEYKIPEPLITAPRVNLKTVDLIIIPTVACDRRGYRLGYGGGYYDRFLSNSQCYQIPKVGITFDFAYLDQLPQDSWDIKLNFICTELQFSSIVTTQAK